MKFSKMIFVLTIAASAIFICMMGSSYSYYTATAINIIFTTCTINNGISVVFTDNNYVNVKTGVPLDDEQVMEFIERLDKQRDEIENSLLNIQIYSNGQITLQELYGMPYKLRERYIKLKTDYDKKINEAKAKSIT